jgi:hypothetical protein
MAGSLVGVDAPSSDVIVPGQFSELLGRSSDVFCCSAWVRLWHKADMAIVLNHVCFWGQSGHHANLQDCPLMTQTGHSKSFRWRHHKLHKRPAYTHSGDLPPRIRNIVSDGQVTSSPAPFFWTAAAERSVNAFGLLLCALMIDRLAAAEAAALVFWCQLLARHPLVLSYGTVND